MPTITLTMTLCPLIKTDQQLLLFRDLEANNHYLGDLRSYSLSAGTWTAISCSGSPPGLRSSNAVWTGSQMHLPGGSPIRLIFSPISGHIHPLMLQAPGKIDRFPYGPV
jgi:hypothetical protein